MTPLPGASAWTLDPDLAYLNHGGFGATRQKMERNPAGFLTRELPDEAAGTGLRPPVPADGPVPPPWT